MVLLASAGLAGACATRPAQAPAAAAVAAPAQAPAAVVPAVQVVAKDGGYVLLRHGQPYYVRGVGGQTRLDLARQLGANSLRTWGSRRLDEIFPQAEAHGMTVLLGVGLSHAARDYVNPEYKAARRAEVTALADKYARHPALLMWTLGNEIQLGADTAEAWQFVEELAGILRGKDRDHPIATATAGVRPETIDRIVRHAPSIEVLGINTYAGLPGVPSRLQGTAFRGAYFITEWGPTGHWEVGKTAWGRPIEQTGAEKFQIYQERWNLIRSFRSCLGSYVFLWGQKQERTPTWYGMFVENAPERGLGGEPTATVDAMAYAWSGTWPSNRAPLVASLELDGKKPADSLVVKPGATVAVATSAEDPDGDPIRYVYELLSEPTQVGSGGSRESRPPTISGAVLPEGRTAKLIAPAPGEYRLFVYAFDGKGKVGTANYPFQVTP